MNGVLNIFKNSGMSSFDVVRIVRKVACEKKVGHTGTLDPEAIGVLPVCLGKATKIIDYYDLRSKVLVGTKIDMSEIVDIMNEADQLIKI